MIYKKIIIVLSITSIIFSGCTNDQSTRPSRKKLIDAVFASGQTKTENEYYVIANTEGYIQKAYVKIGDTVKATRPLFKISNEVQSEQLTNALINYQDAKAKMQSSSPLLSSKRIEIEKAELQLNNDRQTYERFSKLYKVNAISKQEYENAQLKFESSQKNISILEKSYDDLLESLKLNYKNAETQLAIQKENKSDYYLTSNINGSVLSILKEQGELVRRGEKIAKIGGGKPIIKLFVAEEDINEIKLGSKAIISLNTESEKIYESRISKIYPAFDDKEQSFIVEAEFNKLPSKIYSNTQLQANIIINQKEDALVIPTQFIKDGNSVKLKNGKVKVVKVGIKNDKWSEILSGLEEKEEIINPVRL